MFYNKKKKNCIYNLSTTYPEYLNLHNMVMTRSTLNCLYVNMNSKEGQPLKKPSAVSIISD